MEEFYNLSYYEPLQTRVLVVDAGLLSCLLLIVVDNKESQCVKQVIDDKLFKKISYGYRQLTKHF